MARNDIEIVVRAETPKACRCIRGIIGGWVEDGALNAGGFLFTDADCHAGLDSCCVEIACSTEYTLSVAAVEALLRKLQAIRGVRSTRFTYTDEDTGLMGVYFHTAGDDTVVSVDIPDTEHPELPSFSLDEDAHTSMDPQRLEALREMCDNVERLYCLLRNGTRRAIKVNLKKGEENE